MISALQYRISIGKFGSFGNVKRNTKRQRIKVKREQRKHNFRKLHWSRRENVNVLYLVF